VDWQGWETAVLNAGGWPVTPDNVRFLQEWHPYEKSNCGYNPLNTTLPTKGSTNCVHVPKSNLWVQNYISKSSGAKATAVTFQGPFYPNIQAALQQGNPYVYPAPQALADEITTWGTPKYAAFYLQQVTGVTTPPPSPATASASIPSGHSGWGDLRNSVNRHLPTQLARSQALRMAALRALAGRARVKG